MCEGTSTVRKVGVPLCVPVEKTARRAITDASCGSSTRGFLSERSERGGETLMIIGIASYERHGEWWTHCSRAARGHGLPLRLLGSERHAVVLVSARGYMYVGSRQKSRTHSRLQTMDRSTSVAL